MNVKMNNGVAEKFRALLKEEGGDAAVRIRETKVGTACKARIVLRASIDDEREDDDVVAEIDSIPFVINEELVEQYGLDFVITLGEDGMPEVEAAG
ncbi:MAG: ErpA-related iron-sulfur cluster insertion protein [Desulfovibrionaceae bacterium]|nr:ErpA-related iron-sulfur cluster insertion protein [Desulfovibrionaceae bacterium]